MTGKAIRLSRILDKQTGKAVIVTLDDSLLSGPEDGLRHIAAQIQQAKGAKADAILGFCGLMHRHADILGDMPFILNVTASTTRMTHTRKVQVGTVEQAVQIGADAVAVHVNLSSIYETEMLKILGDVSRDCSRWGMPLLAIMYTRGEKPDGADENYLDWLKNEPEKYVELVRHAVRVGVDLGADMIKTSFTGSTESFRTVVECASGVPIFMAGGPKIPAPEFLQKAHAAMQAGASGVFVGRNIFQRDAGQKMTTALRMIVHEGEAVKAAMELAVLAGNS